jgi:hypothetical protein
MLKHVFHLQMLSLCFTETPASGGNCPIRSRSTYDDLPYVSLYYQPHMEGSRTAPPPSPPPAALNGIGAIWPKLYYRCYCHILPDILPCSAFQKHVSCTSLLLSKNQSKERKYCYQIKCYRIKSTSFMRSSRVVRASGCQSQCRNSPESEIKVPLWGEESIPGAESGIE